MGAFFGIWGSIQFGHWAAGLATAIAAGALLALVHAYFSIHPGPTRSSAARRSTSLPSA